MKSWRFDRRVDALSEKLKPVSSDVIRLDFGSFSEAEKQLFSKIWEIEKEYGPSPPADVIEANREFIFKASEVIGWRVLQLFMFVMKELLERDEIEKWYFKLHFYNFFEDLKDCLANVRKWSEKDREARALASTMIIILGKAANQKGSWSLRLQPSSPLNSSLAQNAVHRNSGETA